jgi:2-C-methyl-D-erythritol 4-phosphate cytidylyltransferase
MAEFYALVPAAGLGSRMGSELPKQYMPLAGKPMVYHALATLCANPEINLVFVVLAPGDTYWHRYDWPALLDKFGREKLQPLFCGGATRAESVLNGLLAAEVEPDDWVLVHDAARPCLTAKQLARLIAEVRNDKIGGLLAVPVADTLKRADLVAGNGAGQRVAHTENRAGLWQAQTPQMFPAGLLLQALHTTPLVTDEAAAIEALGYSPKLVSSESTNFKVTYPQDIRLAEWLLSGPIIH